MELLTAWASSTLTSCTDTARWWTLRIRCKKVSLNMEALGKRCDKVKEPCDKRYMVKGLNWTPTSPS